MDIREVVAASSHSFDLTIESSRQQLMALTEQLLADPNVNEQQLSAIARETDCPLEFRLAAKLYSSRRAMHRVAKPVRIGIVFAMWGESARLQKKTADNPNGEDALRVKLDQLNWICRDTPVDWTLYAVDDGDPDNNGAVAQAQADTHERGDQCKVLWLADEVPASSGPLKRLLSVDDSRKGGAVIYGAQQAIDDGVDAVIYTDADNSVHLGQIGLLVEPFANGCPLVVGNRKHADSVLVKSADRWGEGIKTLRHIQRMIGGAIFSRGLSDTQAAFKLYESRLLSQLIATPTVFDFSFDTDWLLGAIAQGINLEQVPFAFIDSESESASAKQNPMTTWETLLFGMLRSLRRHELLVTTESQQMAQVLDEEIRDYRDLERLIDVVPLQLAQATEADFGNPEIMSPAAMAGWIRECCGPQPKQAAHKDSALDQVVAADKRAEG